MNRSESVRWDHSSFVDMDYLPYKGHWLIWWTFIAGSIEIFGNKYKYQMRGVKMSNHNNNAAFLETQVETNENRRGKWQSRQEKKCEISETFWRKSVERHFPGMWGMNDGLKRVENNLYRMKIGIDRLVDGVWWLVFKETQQTIFCTAEKYLETQQKSIFWEESIRHWPIQTNWSHLRTNETVSRCGKSNEIWTRLTTKCSICPCQHLNSPICSCSWKGYGIHKKKLSLSLSLSHAHTKTQRNAIKLTETLMKSSNNPSSAGLWNP